METKDKILGGILARYNAVVEKKGTDYAEKLNALRFLTKDEIAYLNENGIEVSFVSDGYGNRIVLPIDSIMYAIQYMLN